MLFLSDIYAEFEGKKGRSGRKKGSGKPKSRNRTVRVSGGRVIDKPTNSTVTYKSELSPIQKISQLAIAYRNVASPTANLLVAGASVKRLLHSLELANRKPTGWEKAAKLYDGSVNRVGNTSRNGGSIISNISGWEAIKNNRQKMRNEGELFGINLQGKNLSNKVKENQLFNLGRKVSLDNATLRNRNLQTDLKQEQLRNLINNNPLNRKSKELGLSSKQKDSILKQLRIDKLKKENKN